MFCKFFIRGFSNPFHWWNRRRIRTVDPCLRRFAKDTCILPRSVLSGFCCGKQHNFFSIWKSFMSGKKQKRQYLEKFPWNFPAGSWKIPNINAGTELENYDWFFVFDDGGFPIIEAWRARFRGWAVTVPRTHWLYHIFILDTDHENYIPLYSHSQKNYTGILVDYMAVEMLPLFSGANHAYIGQKEGCSLVTMKPTDPPESNLGNGTSLHLCTYIYRRKFKSETSDNMDSWKMRGGKSQRGEEEGREDQRGERVRRKKMQVRKKVGKSRFTVFFKWFVAPEGQKVGLLKRLN